VLPVGVGGVLGGDGVGTAVHTLCRVSGGAPVRLRLPHVYRFFAVPVRHGRHPDVWLWRNIAGCLCIVAFTILFPRNSTPRFFSSRTSAHGFSMRYFVSSPAAHEKPLLAILAIFNARHMSDCSSCTWPPYLATVADMFKTYKTLVSNGSNIEIRLLPLPWTLLWPPRRCWKPDSSTHGDAYQKIHLQNSRSSQHHDVRFCGLCG
jgi:hypothetical protein